MITLFSRGREVKLSEEELDKLLDRFLKEKEREAIPIVRTSTVVPYSIDRRIFTEPRKNYEQDIVRHKILWALDEVEKNPEKYSRPFQILIPKSFDWETVARIKSISEMEAFAKKIGGHLTEDVEQCLEWAQRIDNGDTDHWWKICQDPERAEDKKLVKWGKGYVLVGGSGMSASTLSDFRWYDPEVDYEVRLHMVPSIVVYI